MVADRSLRPTVATAFRIAPSILEEEALSDRLPEAPTDGFVWLAMPELRWAWGYPAVLLLMAATAGALLFYFKRKRWL